MENIYYKKIIIRDENDLPKRKITVFAVKETGGSNKIQGEGFWIAVNPLDSGCMKNLLLFDWYLLEISEEEIKKL